VTQRSGAKPVPTFALTALPINTTFRAVPPDCRRETATAPPERPV